MIRLAALTLVAMTANIVLTVFLCRSRSAAEPLPRSLSVRGPGPTDAVVGDTAPTLTIVRPLRGVDPGARASNRSLTDQVWPGGVDVVFVASDPEDRGLALAREELAAHSRVRCMVAAGHPEATDKASNMMRAWRATRSDLVAFCDADVTLAPDAVIRAAAAFDDPTVAAVFAPVLFLPASLPQRISGLITSGDKLLAVRGLDRWRRLDLMEGGLMLIRRSAVDALGPIEEVLSGTVADDLRLATCLARSGATLRAAPPIVLVQRPTTLAAWAHQYHRWMVGQRAEHPLLLAIQLLLHPLLLPLLAPILHLGSPTAALAMLGASVVWRVAISAVTDRMLLRPHGLAFGWWVLLRPIADLAHFGFCAWAFGQPTVSWGGRTYRFAGQCYRLASRPIVRGSFEPPA